MHLSDFVYCRDCGLVFYIGRISRTSWRKLRGKCEHCGSRLELTKTLGHYVEIYDEDTDPTDSSG